MAPKKAPTHAPYAEMIRSAIVSLKDRKGSSLQALKKKIGKLISVFIILASRPLGVDC